MNATLLYVVKKKKFESVFKTINFEKFIFEIFRTEPALHIYTSQLNFDI